MSPTRKRARCQRRPWSELPHDLLSVILDRLTPSFGDRIRFRGVCQAWRAAELAHPRPPMPWLVAPGHCVSLHDAAIHRVPLPEDAAAAVCRGSFGDWLALVPPTGRRPFLLNAFTMERVMLPRRKKKPLVKFVLSAPPDSKSCTVAAILDMEEDSDYRRRSKIVVCRVGQEGYWRTMTRAFQLHDIIFFEGKLHALDGQARVHVFQDDDLQRDKPWWPPQYIGRQLYSGNELYLVALRGRLHMVGRAFGGNRVPGCTHFTSNVGVFVLGLGDEPAKRPQPVKDLDGHAIFVGEACCDAFPAGASSSGGGKIRENQICFVDDEKNLSSLAAYCLRPCRQLQAYDVRYGCLRTYQPPEPSSGTWRCVTAQRFPHSAAMGPPVLRALSAAEEVLWEVTSCLGATHQPFYYTTRERGDVGWSRVTVCISVPKTAAMRKDHYWRFKQRRPSAREARQAAAHDAARFLRSRFRCVLDESPWSSVPYHDSHIGEHEEEEEEEEEEEAAHSNLHNDDLFGHRRWYSG